MKLKKILLIPLIVILVATNCVEVYASEKVPYQAYNYDYYTYINYTPAAYIPEDSISGADLGVSNMVTPQDMYVSEDEKVYVCDTGNNRILVMDSDLKLKHIIESFDNNGTTDTFKNPSGIFVTKNNEVYIADTDNMRIVILDQDDKLIKIISNPTSEDLESGFQFNPLKVGVDYAGRVYVIAKNMFKGIMAFDENGNFTGFTGTIKVTISAYEKIWRVFSTKAQRARQVQYIPTEFTGIDVAPDGFIYATNVDTKATQSIRRLNPKGQDVIKKTKKGKLSGDLDWGLNREFGGPSRIADIVYRGDGIYSVIDTVRGRIFTYDDEGDLLYIFGGMGTQEGTFKNPAAIEVLGDKILVLDTTRAEVMSFVPTQYGSLINQAVSLRYDGDEASAVEVWKKVLKLDANFELAYVGIGKSYLAAGENKKAMEYLKLGMNQEYYSIAFKRYRDDILKQNLAYILTGGLLLVIALLVWRGIRKRKLKGGAEDE